MAANNQGRQDDGDQAADAAANAKLRSNPADAGQASPVTNQRGTSGRGFASMSPERQREIASEGGKAAHEKGTAHQFSPEEARAAGRKGGQAAHVKGTAHEFNSEEARAAGRKGGLASHSGNPGGNKGGPHKVPER